MIRFLSILIALCATAVSNPVFADCGKDHGAEAPAAEAPAAEAHKCAGCTKGKSGEATWCEGCKVGYADGKKVSCKTCYEHKVNKGEDCKEHAEPKGTEG